MSISDLLGLNSPRGLLGNSFCNPPGLSTPPAAAANYQVSHVEMSALLTDPLFLHFPIFLPVVYWNIPHSNKRFFFLTLHTLEILLSEGCTDET